MRAPKWSSGYDPQRSIRDSAWCSAVGPSGTEFAARHSAVVSRQDLAFFQFKAVVNNDAPPSKRGSGQAPSAGELFPLLNRFSCLRLLQARAQRAYSRKRTAQAECGARKKREGTMIFNRRHFMEFTGTAVAASAAGFPIVGMAQGPPRIIADDAVFELVSRAGKAFAEGVVAAKDGMIYLTDITTTIGVKENNPGGTIYRDDPRHRPDDQAHGAERNGDRPPCR